MTLGHWLRRMVVAIFSRRGMTEPVNSTLMASRRSREKTVRAHQEVRPQIDRGRSLIAAYEAKERALRGRQ